MIAQLLRPQDYLHVKHETIADAIAVELSRHVAPVYFESTLRVGQFGADSHPLFC